MSVRRVCPACGCDGFCAATDASEGDAPCCNARAVLDALRADLLSKTDAGGAHNTPVWLAEILTQLALAGL